MTEFLDLAKDISLGFLSTCGLLLTLLVGFLLGRPEINPRIVLVSVISFLITAVVSVTSLCSVIIAATQPVKASGWQRWIILFLVAQPILFALGLGGLLSSILQAMNK
jgi:ABC-type multidrug transport system permease subunit